MATVVTNTGRDVTTARVGAVGTAEPKNMVWGVSVVTAAVTDTPLFGYRFVDRTTAAGTYHTVGTSTQQTTTVTNDTYQVIGTRTATGAGTVTNAGLFTAASGGSLFLKGDFTGIGLASGDSIQFTIKAIYA